MMPSVFLTPQTSNKAKFQSSIPLSDKSTGLISASILTEIVLGSTLTFTPVVGAFVSVRVRMKLSNSDTALFKVYKSDGVTVLASSSIVSIGTTFIEIATLPVKVTNVSDWTGIRIKAEHFTGSRDITIESNSIWMFQGDFTNLTDEIGIVYHILSLDFISVDLPESIQGKTSTLSDDDFTNINFSGIVKRLSWSSNSGNTIYSWSGSRVGIS